LAVDLGFVVGVGIVQHGDDIAECLHQVGDLGPAHPASSGCVRCSKVGFGLCPFRLGLGDPGGDEDGVCSGVEGCAVLLELRVAGADRGPRGVGERGGLVGLLTRNRCTGSVTWDSRGRPTGR
jgi:hypothetical protein